MAPPASSATTIAAPTGQPMLTHSTPTSAEAKPLTEPTDRSISPTISTQTMPSAMTPTVEESNSRLTRLLLDRKTGLRVWKTVQMITSPTTTGSEPRSPERTRSAKPRMRAAEAGIVADAAVRAVERAAHGARCPVGACRRSCRRETALSVAPVMALTSSWFEESG